MFWTPLSPLRGVLCAGDFHTSPAVVVRRERKLLRSEWGDWCFGILEESGVSESRASLDIFFHCQQLRSLNFAVFFFVCQSISLLNADIFAPR
mmetsp:Transcript_4372/g.12862  ORF Transcript_4372/g.12862 Transcript_4372/m.12862 type:complete len:93 (+) Transcript_4372:1339-1617(+)